MSRPDRYRAWTGLHFREGLALLAAMLVLLTLATVAVSVIEQRSKHVLQDTLTTLLQSTAEALDIWVEGERRVVLNLAETPALIGLVEALLAEPATQPQLLAAPAQPRIRRQLASLLEDQKHLEFFVIGPGNVNLGSSLDASVGALNRLAEQPLFLDRLWSGANLVSKMVFSKVALPETGEEAPSAGDLALFSGAPIRDPEGRVIALLTLRIDPSKTLFSLLARERVGVSGETYVFDRKGVMLNESRFESQLVAMGLIRPGESSAGRVLLRDPGIDLTEPRAVGLPIEQRLPTLMASSAMQRQSGSNMVGYRDYRGVPVVGVWTWHAKLDIGMASEQDVAEAYGLLQLTRTLMYAAAAVVALLLIILAYLFAFGRRELLVAERRLEAIFESTVDGIVVIDAQGQIEGVNDAIVQLFGYPRAAMIGHNVSMLMPEPHRSGHDQYLRNYQQTGEAKIIGIGRELEGLRADGSRFPLELSVSALTLAAGGFFTGIIRDISERKEAEAKLAYERDFSRQILDSLTDQIAVLDDMGRIIFVNRSWRDFGSQNGLEAGADSLQMSYLEAVRNAALNGSDQGQTVYENLTRMLNGEQDRFEVEYDCHAPDELRWFRMRCRSLAKQDGGHILVSHSNITDRVLSEKSAIEEKEAAQAANKAKSVFLAAMSHEIRTPLNGVVGMIDVLAYTSLDPKQRDLILSIQDSSNILTHVIDDILDFSKIEAGGLRLEMLPISVEAVLESVGDALRTLATANNVDLLVFCDARIPRLLGDSVRLQQVLYNLTGNAIKFTKGIQDRQGRVYVIAKLVESENGFADICLQVSDNGIGMTPEVQARIFQPFSQGEESTTRHYGGTGLGLVICNRLVEMMDGRIEVESRPGQGTRVAVYLRLEASKDATPSAAGTLLSGLRALLVSNDETAAQMLQGYFTQAGALVETVPLDGALRRVRDWYLDGLQQVVLIDGGDDPDRAKLLRDQLRQLGTEGALRFVLFGRGNRRYVRADGDNGVMLDLGTTRRSQLLNAVAASMGWEPAQQADPTSETEITTTPVSTEAAEAAGQLILVAEDYAINQKVIRQQLAMLGYAAEFVEDGVQALERWRSDRYALLLTDCHMPNMDGYDLARAIREQEGAGRRIPIIAITADALKGVDVACLAAGMDDYLTKPIKLKRLQAMLERWMPLPRGTEQDHGSAPETATEELSASDAGVVDIDALSNILGADDPALLASFYRDFLTSGAELVEAIVSGYGQKNITEMGTQAHKLKSAARTVGANALADTSFFLEQAGKQGDADVEAQIKQLGQQFEQVRQWIGAYLARSGTGD